MNSSILTLRLDEDLNKRLEKLARSTHRSKSFLAAEAIRQYIALNERHTQEIKKAIKEADAGDFVCDRDVQKIMSKWTKIEYLKKVSLVRSRSSQAQ